MSDVTHDQNASSWLQYSVKYTPGYMPFSKYDDFNNSYSLWRFCLKTKFTSSRSYTDVKWKHDQDSAFGDYKWKHHARGIGEKQLLAAINRDFGFSTARGLSCHERPRLGNCFPPHCTTEEGTGTKTIPVCYCCTFYQPVYEGQRLIRCSTVTCVAYCTDEPYSIFSW